MTSREAIEAVRDLSEQQVAALRAGDLDHLDALSMQRKALMEDLDPTLVFADARLAALLGEILENDRKLKSRLHMGLQERRRALAELERRSEAEQAYRRDSV